VSTLSHLHRASVRRPRPSLVATALLLDALFAVLMAAFFLLFAVTSGPGAEETFFSNLPLALTLLGAAAVALAGGVLGFVGLIRERPRTPLGRLAFLAPLLPYALLALGGVLVAVGVGATAAFAAFNVGWPALTLAAVVGGFAAGLRGDRPALLVPPLAIGLFVAVWTIGELLGHA
jgi:hypothetical protein